MARIVIGNSDFEQVIIEVLGTPSFEGWSVAHVEIACGAWSGSFDCEFAAGELHDFGKEIQQLYHSLDGTASLTPLEPHLELRLAGDGKGHIEVSGKAVVRFQTRTYLAFEFSLDQTQLPEIAAALLRT